jgi:hypothetical protein
MSSASGIRPWTLAEVLTTRQISGSLLTSFVISKSFPLTFVNHHRDEYEWKIKNGHIKESARS